LIRLKLINELKITKVFNEYKKQFTVKGVVKKE